jgi:hypothetical protein
MPCRNCANEISPNAMFCGACGQKVREITTSSASRRFVAWTAGVLLTIVLIQLCAGLIAGVESLTGVNAIIRLVGWLAGGYLTARIADFAAKKIASGIDDKTFGTAILVPLILLAALDAVGGGNNANAWIGSFMMIFFGAAGVIMAARG